MSLSSRRIGTILNILFAINWLFVTLVFVNVRKSEQSLTGSWEIVSYLVPLITWCLAAVYVYFNYYRIKKLLPEYQVKGYQYLKIITMLITITILANLLILLGKNREYLNLGFGLAMGISSVCGLMTIILDINFFIKSLKWADLSIINTKIVE